MIMPPTARTSSLLQEPVGSDLVVYDTIAHQTHLLNPTAAFVFRHCDGRRTVEELTRLLQQVPGMEAATGEVVLLALEQLRDAGLLEGEDAPALRYTRAEVLTTLGRRMGMGLAAGVILAPLVQSLAAPHTAHADTLSF
jgi:hypothetical protein